MGQSTGVNGLDWEELQALFTAALALPASDRGPFLDRACAGRPELRRELDAMLAATGSDKALKLEARLLGWDDEATSQPAALPDYRFERLLGRGGMGDVYLATREGDEFDQQVAVKLMRPGLFGPDLARRFRDERQILARLAHPLVVPLLDGGVTEDGRPYLVMPYVDGTPITEYCDERRLPLGERVRLLAAVCRAVQHAHANLVVHRDLKPPNILVTADGEPQLLDFGIAKLLDPETGEPADVTRAQLVRMTPERAAPEQLRGGPVSTATDVYALGVLLFELATGRLPPAAKPDAAATVPPRPSAVVTESPPTAGGTGGVDAAERAAARATTSTALRRSLRGDFDRIALKALNPEPVRRYASASQLGDDLERFLAGRPVLAQPDRWAYRVRKFVRRHRAAVLAAALALALLIAFSVTSALQARRIAAERDRAGVEEAKAKQMLDLLVGLFETTDPRFGPGGETLVVDDFLAEAREKIAALSPQPDLQARMEHVLGRIYLARHRYREARELFEHAHALRRVAREPDEVFAVDLEIDLARALERTSDLKGSELLLSELLPRLRRVRGEDHPLVTQTLVRLGRLLGGKEGETLAERALANEHRRQPPNPHELARALAGVAAHRSRAGDRAAAEALYRQASEIFIGEYGEEHPSSQTALTNLAGVLEDFDEKVALYRRVITMGRRVLGPESAPVGNRLNNLGVLLRRNGRFDDAEAALTEAARIWSEVGGPHHWRTAQAERNLAAVYELQGRREEALELTEKALGAARMSTGTYPRVLGTTATQWAELLGRAGRHDEALAAAREAVELLESRGGRAPDRADARLVLGKALLRGGSAAAAEVELRSALTYREEKLAPEDPRLGEARCALGRALIALGQGAEAEPLLRQGLATLRGWSLAYAGDVEACRRALA